MQSVTSVANPLYGVQTLTSAASSTVRRTRVAVPVNQDGTYSHRQSDIRYIAQCTIGSNQDGIITENTYWEFDITPTWWDQSQNPLNATLPPSMDALITPTFDQDVSALISRIKISTPQGLVIEEIPLYNQLNNIINSYTLPPPKKNNNLIALSSWTKDILADRGHNQIIDSAYYKNPTFSYSLRHGKTTRIQIPMSMSSFFKSCKFLPTFLLRNGIQFEIEFEDPYRAFVLESGKNQSHSWKQHDIPHVAQATVSNAAAAGHKVIPNHMNFVFGPGTLTSTGGVNVRDPINYPNVNTFEATNYCWPNYFRIGDRVLLNNVATASANAAYGMAPGCCPRRAADGPAGPVGNTSLQNCKNFLYLDEATAAPMLDLRNKVARSYRSAFARVVEDATKLTFESQGFGQDSMVLCVPLILKRDGVPVHRFFTSMSLFNDAYSWGYYGPATIGNRTNGNVTWPRPAPTGFLPFTSNYDVDYDSSYFLPAMGCIYNAQAALGANGGYYFAFSPSDHIGARCFDNDTNLGAGPNDTTSNIFWTGSDNFLTSDRNDTNSYITTVGHAASQVMLAFPCYKYNHFSGDSDGQLGHIPIFPMDVGNNFNIGTWSNDFFATNWSLDIGTEDAFLLRLTSPLTDAADVLNLATYSSPYLRDPVIRDLQHVINYGRHYMTWNYTIQNIRMIVDMCQPSSDVFSEYSRAFQSRIGIPYAMTRLITVDRTFDVGTTGSQQFTIPISARSLKSLLITFDDPYFQSFSRTDGLGRFYTPFLSSFMRRGLVNLTLTIGGATKPEYVLRFDRNGGVEHIVEASSAFGVPFVTGFTPQFSKDALAPTRSYYTASQFDQQIGALIGYWGNRTDPASSIEGQTVSPLSNGIDYIDSHKFIIGIPLSRTDKFSFASGLDSTMSSSLVLTATFEMDGQPNVPRESYDPGRQWGRQIHMTVRGEVDAVVTLNSDLSTIRW